MRRWILLCLLAGCSREPATETLLADYDFFRLEGHPIYGAQLGEDVGLHCFYEGWETPKGSGLVAAGPATVLLQSLGREGVLRLRYRGQADLRWDGQEIATLASDRWDTLRVQIPPPLFAAGAHELGFDSETLTLASLQLRAQLSDDELAEWRRLHESPPADPRWQLAPAATSPPNPDPATLPDILILVLDTLRADHVGAYGYERVTTPNIDALAAEGLLFPRVYADASYTLTSVSSLLTGRSWQEHRVFDREDALPGGMPTLAGVLSAAGYQTRAISDNPNVSRARQHDRGFDEFREAWHRNAPTDWNPEVVEVEFEESLRTPPAPGPTLYYVHMMPPHSPYFPGEAHDRFGDADYDGPIRGSVAQIAEFDRGERDYDEADRQRLISLYDGGLHRGDAMLGRIRERWLALGRERPLMTIVLSDHGEGFGEHGRYGHNSTVYDEMTHVPLILHPAALVEPLAGGVDRFHGLPDLMPMLLSLLKIPLGEEAWPRSFLRVYEQPTIERDVLFVRGIPHLYGLRRPDSLTLLRLWADQESYDLTVDPAATNNLRIQESGRYLSDLRALRSLLEHEIGTAEAGEIELSEEEMERLRALGYF